LILIVSAAPLRYATSQQQWKLHDMVDTLPFFPLKAPGIQQLPLAVFGSILEKASECCELKPKAILRSRIFVISSLTGPTLVLSRMRVETTTPTFKLKPT
jgi:hypothetical protein